MSLKESITRWSGARGLSENDPLQTENALGIELEYESFRWGDVHDQEELDLDWWVTETDGSLRNSGVELVSSPLLYDNVEQALLEAEATVEEFGAESSARCGLHTHMNMRPYSIGQVWSLAALYALIEPTLFQTYALGREDSIYAVPLWANTRQQRALSADICAARSRTVIGSGACSVSQSSKYAALNFSSLSQFGTLEMRQPYCTNDFEAIRSWTDFIQRLVIQGVAHHDPDTIIAWYELVGLAGIQRAIFGEEIDIDEERQEWAEDAAYVICGYAEPTWQELNWENVMCAA